MDSYKSSDMTPRPPRDFAALLINEEPLFLVGGQAVNIWALYYHKRIFDLQPFVSRDIDILGNRETLISIARTAGVKPKFFPMRPPTNEVGVVIAKGLDGEPLPVEVLSSLHGIKNKDLQHPAYTIGIAESDVLVRVPGPIALLQAKIANVADLDQKDRQDKHHVEILIRLMPAYLADIQISVSEGRINEREMLDLLEHLLTVTMAPKSCKILNDMKISGEAMFSEINASPHSKLHSFMTERLPRIFLK